MSTAPELTFAIPFHRNVDYLRSAIDSVREQTIDRWRLLVCDDAGPDPESADLVRSYRDDRISYSRNPTNLGLAGNWNRCLELADTELVTLLHADDTLFPGYGAAVVSAHRRAPDAAAVFTRATVIDADGGPMFSVPDLAKQFIAPRSRRETMVAGEPGLARLMRGQFIFCPTLCYRRSVLGPTPFSDRWGQVLDLELLAELLLAGKQLVGIPDLGYAYRRHAASQTAQLTATAQRFEEELAVFDEIADRAEARGWARAASIARRKRIVQLHLAYRVVGSVLTGRREAVRVQLGLLRRARRSRGMPIA